MSDRYEIIAPLAEGGQGEIWLARRVGPAGFAKLVVLKKPKGVRSSAAIAALIEEARLLAQISHTNVCQVHDLEEANGELFLALEYLEGLTAWDLLASADLTKTPIEIGALCGIVAQACDGLAAIHKLGAGVVHRDISPSNLFVTEAGTVKILDLGIAKSLDSDEHTPLNQIKGKLTYLSPEQVQGRPVDSRADLFALGLVLHDLAKGRRPPRDRLGALAAIVVDDLPPPIADIVRRATASERDARYASAAELAAAMRAAGAALGGFYERGEIAEWLARRFAEQLEQRVRRLRAAEEHTRSQTLPASRVMTMRSALHDDPSAIATRVHASQASFTGGTEELPVPERERLTSSAYFGGERVEARPGARRRRGVVAIVGAAAGIAAMVVALAVGIGGSSETAKQVQPPAVATAQPHPQPAPVVEPPPPLEQQPAPVREPPPLKQQPTAAPPEADPARHEPHPVRVTNTEKRRARPKPAPAIGNDALEGMLTIDSSPYAVIKIDGTSVGTTPLYRVTLAVGRHRVVATDPSGRVQEQTITIDEGKEKRLRLEWGKP